MGSQLHAMRINKVLAGGRFLVYSVGFCRLLYWHSVQCCRAFKNGVPWRETLGLGVHHMPWCLYYSIVFRFHPSSIIYTSSKFIQVNCSIFHPSQSKFTFLYVIHVQWSIFPPSLSKFTYLYFMSVQFSMFHPSSFIYCIFHPSSFIYMSSKFIYLYVIQVHLSTVHPSSVIYSSSKFCYLYPSSVSVCFSDSAVDELLKSDHTRWCAPAISCFLIPINYRYNPLIKPWYWSYVRQLS